MRVLVTGTEGAGIDEVQRRFRAAGHDVCSCDADDGSHACSAATPRGTCPGLRSVDVIVAARLHPLPTLTAREERVACALLHDVPLVVAGSAVGHPFGGRPVALVDGFGDVVAVTEGVAGRPAAVLSTPGSKEPSP